MKLNRKRYWITSLVLPMIGFSAATYAVPVTGTAKVYNIVAFDSASTFSDALVIRLTSLGKCPVDSNTGYVILRYTHKTGSDPSNNRIYALAYAAYSLGKQVTVQADDTVLLNGSCEIQYIQLAN